MDGARLEETVAQGSVMVLQHQRLEPELAGASSTNFSRVKRTSEQRKHRHDATVKQFDDDVAAFSEALEARVLEASRAVKQQLGDLDKEHAAALARLGDDEWLVQLDHAGLAGVWSELETLCQRHKDVVTAFESALDGVEQERAQHVGGLLQRLLAALTDIAHLLPPEIERLVESKCHDMNVVMIGNRR